MKRKGALLQKRKFTSNRKWSFLLGLISCRQPRETARRLKGRKKVWMFSSYFCKMGG